jgi:energy-coupling factor transporter ATP-binding protein EcfA2
MKILQFTAENIKRLRVVSITPDGALVQITGPNGSGKSSVLDAIYFALAGKSAIDPEPIRKGADRARIRLDLGEIIVKRLFTPKGTTLEVEAADGTPFKSPQSVLDNLLGTLTFDPLAFLRADPKTRIAMLREAVPLDVDVDALDRKRAEIYTERTDVARRLKQFEAEAATLPDPKGAPTESVSVLELSAELEAANRHNNDQKILADALVRGDRLVAEAADAVAHFESKLAEAKAILEMKQNGRKVMPLPGDEIDLAPIRAKIKGAEETNRAYHSAQRARDVRTAIRGITEEVAGLTRQIEDIDEQKRSAMERAKFPVAGLAFGDGDVQYNGFPFSQASGAEQLRVSAALAMAANPKLRVIRIKDGSLLDEKSLAILEQMAVDADYQVWLEMVDTSGKVGIVMEDGHVAAMPMPPETETPK